MKIMVDKMPEKAQDCLFSAMGTGKARCRHDAKLCPLLSGGKCPHLTEIPSPKPDVELDGAVLCEAVIDAVSEPVKRTTERSTAKKAERGDVR